MWQQDGSHLGKELVKYDEEALLGRIHPHLTFWEGRTAPKKVPDTELWKCHRCLYNSHCYDPANRADRCSQQPDDTA